MVTRKVILVTSPEAAALATTTESSSSSAAAPTSTKKSTDGNTNKNGGGKKRALPSGEDLFSGRDVKKRQRTDRFVLDLTDVPPQQPILKSADQVKEGSSKYTGVTFRKTNNKWQAHITIEGKQRSIGSYEDEEEAAIDYSRAVFKYKGQDVLDKKRERTPSAPSIDLSDVPPQLPIPKREAFINEGASKYTGVSFDKRKNKWQAQVRIDGKKRRIGYYVNEEEAGIDYARALVKYKGHDGALHNARKQYSSVPAIDLSDAPPQLPILKSANRVKEGASKYAGVTFYKASNKWQAQIWIEGHNRHIGYYEKEEEAAVDFARAVFKYQGQDALDKAREQNSSSSNTDRIEIDLTDVPPQLPIPKSKGYIKEGASKYTGVYFNKKRNKWRAQITFDGKSHRIGYYENEEEAAIDYARAVFKYKYKGREALDEAREQLAQSSSGLAARAVVKYKGEKRQGGVSAAAEDSSIINIRALPSEDTTGGEKIKKRKRNDMKFVLDLTDVPPQQPVPKSKGYIKEGASKYTGISFHKATNKWEARITIDGKQHHIGYYEKEEEAAIDYARALFKYNGRRALDKARERAKSSTAIELSDVPPQQLIPKSEGRIKEGASKYTGVTFNKATNKWQARMKLEGKQLSIGWYENEEEAAADYARAAFKYKG